MKFNLFKEKHSRIPSIFGEFSNYKPEDRPVMKAEAKAWALMFEPNDVVTVVINGTHGAVFTAASQEFVRVIFSDLEEVNVKFGAKCE